MNEWQKNVRDFHLKYGHSVEPYPSLTGTSISQDTFRKELHLEELNELHNGMDKTFDLCQIADGIGDLIYVLLGTALYYGIDMEPVFAEIHRTNMLKSTEKNQAGKTVKGPDWTPPDIARILKEQQDVQ